jgi:flagellar M-ring protein FliF
VAVPFALPPWSLAAAAAILLGFAAMVWLWLRRTPAAELEQGDFGEELEAVRNQVLANPRVTADVIKLWMRA